MGRLEGPWGACAQCSIMSLCGLCQLFCSEPVFVNAICDSHTSLEGGPTVCPVMHPIPWESGIPIGFKARDTHVTMRGRFPGGGINLTSGTKDL